MIIHSLSYAKLDFIVDIHQVKKFLRLHSLSFGPLGVDHEMNSRVKSKYSVSSLDSVFLPLIWEAETTCIWSMIEDHGPAAWRFNCNARQQLARTIIDLIPSKINIITVPTSREISRERERGLRLFSIRICILFRS